MSEPSDISTKTLPDIVVPGATPAPEKPLLQLIVDPSQTKYLNREISWLRFNMRVLAEAHNEVHPLLERMRFLSISASNLEEFFMVRVAGLNDQVTRGIETPGDDGKPPQEQLAEVLKMARKMMDDQQSCLNDLTHSLDKNGVKLVKAAELTQIERKWVETFFLANVFPTLTPIAIDPAHPFPFLPNRSLTAIYTLEDEHKGRMTALVLLPNKLPRFIRLSGHHSRQIALEEVLDLFQFLPGLPCG